MREGDAPCRPLTARDGGLHIIRAGVHKLNGYIFWVMVWRFKRTGMAASLPGSWGRLYHHHCAKSD